MKITVDRDRCVGSAYCQRIAPAAFTSGRRHRRRPGRRRGGPAGSGRPRSGSRLPLDGHLGRGILTTMPGGERSMSGSPSGSRPPLRDMGILVTGGGSGIGLAVSRRLLADGAAVTIAGRNAQRLRDASRSSSTPVPTLRPSAPTLPTCPVRMQADGPSRRPAIFAAGCTPPSRARGSPGARWPR